MEYKRICYFETAQTAQTARLVKSMVKYRPTAHVNHGRQVTCSQTLEAINETASYSLITLFLFSFSMALRPVFGP